MSGVRGGENIFNLSDSAGDRLDHSETDAGLRQVRLPNESVTITDVVVDVNAKAYVRKVVFAWIRYWVCDASF